MKINGTINTIGNSGFANGARGTVFQHGYQVIFLPLAGYRNFVDGSITLGSNGSYWSSTFADYDDAYYLGFIGSSLVVQGRARNFGLTLRCVQN